MGDPANPSNDETWSLPAAPREAAPAPARVEAVPVAPPPSANIDLARLSLSRFGVRFVDAEVEQAYRRWHREVAIPFTRAGMWIALIGFGIALLLGKILELGGFARALALIVAFPTPLIVLTIALSHRARAAQWIPFLTALANLAGSLTVLITLALLVGQPQLATAGVIMSAFMAFTVFRMRPLAALLSVAPTILLQTWILSGEASGGRLDGVIAAIHGGVSLVACLSGYLACISIDRTTRGAYRQERIVELQREVIDQLQRAELQRQVAERSRGLAEALSRLTAGPRAHGPLAVADVVDDRYRIVRLLGRGGMGQVHEVERLADGRHFALKTLAGIAEREALARFAREAQVAAELDHPNVVNAVDIGVTQSGLLFLVMDLVAGSSLAAESRRFGDAAWALPILAQVADAVAAMHARGIIHRDLKPSNILLDGTRAKVADFGLAGLLDPKALGATLEPGVPDLTRTGAILGTPAYMAPELAVGAGEAGRASDVFSLGVVAHQLLSGRLPHAAPPLLERLAGRALPAAQPLQRRDLAPDLCLLLDRCLAEAASARPSAADLVAALGHVI